MNTKDMSFGEAMDWMNENDGREVCVVNSPNLRSRFYDGKLQFNSFAHGEAGFINDNDNLMWKFDKRWMVVQPKSPIEEAIERESKRAVAMNDVNGEAACWRVSAAMRRVVNLTLDEAKKAVGEQLKNSDWIVGKAIDALKVKE